MAEQYEFKGTPGPWRWEVNEKYKTISVCGGKPTYDKTVMDFDRWGMAGATPCFRGKETGLNVIKMAVEFAVVSPGREHHSDWFKEINQPDANLMVAAPDLLDACIAALNNSQSALSEDVVLMIKNAVQKALK